MSSRRPSPLKNCSEIGSHHALRVGQLLEHRLVGLAAGEDRQVRKDGPVSGQYPQERSQILPVSFQRYPLLHVVVVCHHDEIGSV